MSRPHDAQRPFFPLGNPLRLILPRGSYLSPKLLALLNSFEETLAERLNKLKPKNNSDVHSLAWMRLAIESLCETHADIKTLITELQFPVSDWDEKWMDMYLDNSVKLLDICNAFSSEISQLNQGQLLLQYVLHVLHFSSGTLSSEQIVRARASLHEWMQQVSSKNPKLENCSAVLRGLAGSLYLPKFKNSAKGKVLVRAMYGIKVETIFVCSILTAAFSGSANSFLHLNISDKVSWSEAFNDLQSSVYGEVRRQFSLERVIILKEVQAVHGCVEKLYAVTDAIVHLEAEKLQKCTSGLSESMGKLAEGLHPLSKQVEVFFQIVLMGRDALLCSLRDLNQENNVADKVVR